MHSITLYYDIILSNLIFEIIFLDIYIYIFKYIIMHYILAVIVGGIDMMTQSLALAKKPHIIIGKNLFYILHSLKKEH